MNLDCTQCQSTFSYDGPVMPGAELSCPECHALGHLQACCSDCCQPLEPMKACGAIQYFCNHCRKLVSKSSLVWRNQPI